jgi:hypothetical protein
MFSLSLLATLHSINNLALPRLNPQVNFIEIKFSENPLQNVIGKLKSQNENCQKILSE